MRKTLFILVTLLLLALPSQDQISAQESPADKKEGVVINIAGAKLVTILNYISRQEGKPLLLDPSFPKEEQINMISPPGVSIPPDKLIDVMEAILRMKGYAIIYIGPVLKVVKSVEARTSPTMVRGIEELEKLEGEDRIITQIIPLEHADAMAIVSLLNQLKSKEATVQPSRETNSLILTEYTSNIRRLYKVIKQIDRAPPPSLFKTEVKQLKHASAAALSTRITQYLQALHAAAARPGTRVRTQPPKAFADEQTNSIIILALPDQLKQISNLIDALDAKVAEEVSRCYTYKLTNTSAEEVAKIVQAIFTKQLQAMVPSGRKPDEVVSISAEKSLNSLVIVAPPKVYERIEELIELIDVPKEQVLLEVAIVELSNEKMIELGIELAAVEGPTDKGTGFGGTAFSMSELKDSDDLSQGKNPIISEGLTVGIWKETIGNIPFLLKAAKTDTGIDVLAVPRLVANDNAEASIDISDEIPYPKQTVGPDGTVTSTSYDYESAGIRLKITPHIGKDNYLMLEIEQSEEQFFESTYSTTMPARTKRTTKTTVTVPDKKTVILGGLTRENITKKVKKIPLLGDIPLLGLLFRWTKDEVKKSNLCIFITPHIMRHSDDLAEKTKEYKKALERVKKSQQTTPEKKKTE